jgi:hypothetical protein
MYQEKYPTGKRNYEMVEFGPIIEKRSIYIPEDCKDPNALLEETHQRMHDRLVRVVGEMVNKAIQAGRIVGVPARK